MRIVPWFSVAALLALAGPSRAAPSSDEQAVLLPLQNFLAGIAKGDKALMFAQVLPDAMITRVKDGKVIRTPVRSLIEGMPPLAGRKLEERLYEPLVRIDEDLAIIWTRYDFFIDGKVAHCGVDVAEVVRRDGHWVITGLADTGRTTCGAAPAH